MTPTEQWLLSQILIIIGSLGIGFATGCRVMSRKATRMIESDASDKDDEAYRCSICNLPVREVPPGLKGRFTHARCERQQLRSDAILRLPTTDY